ncbi:MAG TPA: tetratricopeptide repeat protein [Terriglobales bacterium]|nr:tetratricopeptide repeat protein [Terriglobales bacterium]
MALTIHHDRSPLVTDHWPLTTAMDRIEMLTQFLAENPGDAFARYGLAMEYSKLGQVENALEHFGKLLERHPDYTAGYFMAAQTLAAAGRTDEARSMLRRGITSAENTGNAHAKSEMEGMLAELG